MTTIPPGGLISLVHFDDANDHYWIGWANQLQLHCYDTRGNRLMAIPLKSEPVDMALTAHGLRVTVMGHFLRNFKEGAVLEITTDAESGVQQVPLVTNYHRLTESHLADLDGDGASDLLLVGFGQGRDGEVSIRWGVPEGAAGRFEDETVLLNYSGADNAVIHDFDHDQRPDLMVLTAQREQELLLFLNKGDLSFTEKFFYPMFGALKAIAEDFDHDGDLDLAAIAYYPDWAAETPETFAYLENLGDYRFQPAILKADDWGRWISMTTGDVDNDGYRDVILGGAYHPIGVDMNHYERYLQRIRGKASVIVLRNTGRDATKPAR